LTALTRSTEKPRTFPASDDARYVTGQSISIDGGRRVV